MAGAMPDNPPSADATAATLAALQDLGAARCEPLRFHFASALARRSSGHSGAVRQQLDARLAAALADLQQRVDRQAVPPPAQAAAPGAGAPGPLGQLVRALAAATPPTGAAAAPPAELRAVRQFGATWAGLRVDQQLQRAQDQQPGNAGPLNSQRLVLQALQQLRQLSPAYLQRLLAHAETLLWLERAALDVPSRRAGRAADAGGALTLQAAGRPPAAPTSPATRPPGSRAAPSRTSRSRATPRSPSGG